LNRTLASNPNASAFLRSKALNSAAPLSSTVGNWEQVRAYANEALALARANDDRRNMAWALLHLGLVELDDLNEFASLLEEGLRLFRELDDPLGLSHALYRRTYRAIDQKDYSYARILLKEMTIRSQEANDKYMAACASIMMGRVVWAEDNNLVQTK